MGQNVKQDSYRRGLKVFRECQQICQSFCDCRQICQSVNLPGAEVNLPADLVTVTKSASQQICQQKWGEESASRFSNSPNLPVMKSAARNGGVNMLADLETVTKSASRNGGNLPANLVTVTKSVGGGKSASSFCDCHQICQSTNLPAEMGG